MLKEDFPIFKNNPDLIYLDNGATSQKPQVVIDAISDYYSHDNSNIGRSVYKLAERSQALYDEGRALVADFLHTEAANIVFTPSCTESLNQAAFIIGQHIEKQSKIVISILEHHANILPWQRLAKEKEAELVFIKDIQHILNPELLPDSFWQGVKVISLTHVSNVTGLILPIKKWIDIAKEKNIITVIDGAQGVCAEIVNVEYLDCDFYTFSAHKLFGPTGLGILYMKSKFLHTSEPLVLGGGIIEDVLEQEYMLLEDNVRFEAGSPNVASVVGFSESLRYLKSNNWSELLNQTAKLGDYLFKKLSENADIELLPREHAQYSHIASFHIKDIHPHDIGTYLSQHNIAVRVGKHCTHPLHSYLKINSTVRVSLAFYNTQEDIDKLLEVIEDCVRFFRRA